MSFHEFRRLIDENHGLLEVKIQGMGEPILGGDDYFAMIKYARSQGIWVRTVTNGSLLHLKENFKSLLDCDPNEIQVSIDGATQETFEAIRRNSHFNRVIANVSQLNHYAETVGRKVTKMWTVVQQRNAHELPQLVNLAADLGFSACVFSLDVGNWGKSDWQKRQENIATREQPDIETLWDLVAQGENLGVRVAFWNIEARYSAENLCPWPNERTYVSSDMRIVPCCMVADPDTYEIGTTPKEGLYGEGRSFADIWFGEEYKEFRAMHRVGLLPQICQGCYKSST
jgi:pyrroloquinoline quinone biosynthesis protein E